jgi:predicted nucleic acid-binding protein
VSDLRDTNVLSEARRQAPQAAAWRRAVDPPSLFLSMISVGEITKGIAIRDRTDPPATASLSRRLWMDCASAALTASCRSPIVSQRPVATSSPAAAFLCPTD